MKPVSLDKYVKFGGNWMFLERATTTYRIHGERWFLDARIYVMDKLKELSFDITLRILGKEQAFFDALSERPKDDRLSQDDVKQIQDMLQNLSCLRGRRPQHFTF